MEIMHGVILLITVMLVGVLVGYFWGSQRRNQQIDPIEFYSHLLEVYEGLDFAYKVLEKHDAQLKDYGAQNGNNNGNNDRQPKA